MQTENFNGGRKILINSPNDLHKKLQWGETGIIQAGLSLDHIQQRESNPLSQPNGVLSHTLGAVIPTNGAVCNKVSNVRITSMNVCGLQSKLELGYLDYYLKDTDIICLTEAKTDIPGVSESLLTDYKAFSQQKNVTKAKYGGAHGICVQVKNTLACLASVLPSMNSNHVLWIKISDRLLGFGCVAGAVYMLGESSPYFDDNAFDTIGGM